MIETVYRVRVDFEVNVKGVRLKLAEVTLENILNKSPVGSEIFYGNPACAPYIAAEFDSYEEATQWEAGVKQVIQKFGEIKED